MRALALRISERSESLKDMMARELSQFDRQLATVKGRLELGMEESYLALKM